MGGGLGGRQRLGVGGRGDVDIGDVGDVDGEAVGGNPVLVVAAGVLDKVSDFGLHGAGRLPLGDHGGPRGVAQSAAQGGLHEGQRVRLSGHLWTLKYIIDVHKFRGRSYLEHLPRTV